MTFLLGCKSGAKVSRYEHFKRLPSLKTAFAYQVIFRISIEELFPGIYQQVEGEASKRVQLLIKRLNNSQPDLKILRKLETLKAVSSRSPITVLENS